MNQGEIIPGIIAICDQKRHLVCQPYSIDNLHAVAAHLMIRRAWFHRDHYDIPAGRMADVMKRCRVVHPREIVKIIGIERKPARMVERPKLVGNQLVLPVTGIALRMTRIRPATAKRESMNRRYNRRNAESLAETLASRDPYCPVMKAINGELVLVSETHHTHGRSGLLLCYEPWWLHVSGAGHIWIHEHISLAREMGWYCQHGQWNSVTDEVRQFYANT